MFNLFKKIKNNLNLNFNLINCYQLYKNMNKKVYLAGQPNEYENNWKESFKKIVGFDFYDWEFDSNQTSADTFFLMI